MGVLAKTHELIVDAEQRGGLPRFVYMATGPYISAVVESCKRLRKPLRPWPRTLHLGAASGQIEILHEPLLDEGAIYVSPHRAAW